MINRVWQFIAIDEHKGKKRIVVSLFSAQPIPVAVQNDGFVSITIWHFKVGTELMFTKDL